MTDIICCHFIESSLEMTEDFTTLPWKCGMKMTVKSGWITLDWDILQKNSEVVVSNGNL